MGKVKYAVTNTILGRMQSASTCPTCGSGFGQNQLKQIRKDDYWMTVSIKFLQV
jgi:hypothetical protein